MLTRSLGLSFFMLTWAVLSTRAESAEYEQDGSVLITDSGGEPVYAADAVGNELTFVYDAAGQLIATIDQDGVVVDWEQLIAVAEARQE